MYICYSLPVYNVYREKKRRETASATAIRYEISHIDAKMVHMKAHRDKLAHLLKEIET